MHIFQWFITFRRLLGSARRRLGEFFGVAWTPFGAPGDLGRRSWGQPRHHVGRLTSGGLVGVSLDAFGASWRFHGAMIQGDDNLRNVDSSWFLEGFQKRV